MSIHHFYANPSVQRRRDRHLAHTSRDATEPRLRIGERLLRAEGGHWERREMLDWCDCRHSR